MLSYLGIAWEGYRVASGVIKHGILGGKDLLVQDVGDVVKLVPPVKHVLAVGVQVPVKDVCGCVVAHVTVGDEAHVGMLGSDGCEKSNVVFHVPRLAAVLHTHTVKLVHLPLMLASGQGILCGCVTWDAHVGVLDSDGCEDSNLVSPHTKACHSPACT